MLTFHLDIIYVNLLQWSCQLTYTSLLPQIISPFWKYCVPSLSVRFLGNGLVTAQNHEQWYKQRRIMDPAFSSLWVIKSSQGDRAEYLLNLLFLYPVLVVKWNPVQIMVLFSSLILFGNIVQLQNFCGALEISFGHACPLTESAIIYRYLRGLMGTFNERAERLMDKLTEIAEKKIEANMLHLVNCVTMDVIGKVFVKRVKWVVVSS